MMNRESKKFETSFGCNFKVSLNELILIAIKKNL